MNRQQPGAVKVNVAISPVTQELLRQARYVFGNTSGFTVDEAVALWAKKSGLHAALERKAMGIPDVPVASEPPTVNFTDPDVMSPADSFVRPLAAPQKPVSADPDVARQVEKIVGEGLLKSFAALGGKSE